MTRLAFNLPLENNFQKFGFTVGLTYLLAILVSIVLHSPQRALVPSIVGGEDTSPDSVASAGAVFRDFDRTEFKDGKSKWNIKAHIAEYLSGGGFIKLTSPDVKIFGEGKERPTLIKAKFSRLTLKEGKVETALLEGDVEIKSGTGAIIHTSTAEYLEKESRLTTPEHVYIDGPGYHIEGDSSEVNTLTDEVLVSGNVTSKFESSMEMPVNLKKGK